MKKILFLIHDLGQGGAEKVLVNLVNNMDRNKFDISVTALFGGGVNEQFLASHIKFNTVFSKAIPGNSKLMKLLSPKQLYKMCVKDKYDIVVSYLEGPSARVVSGCNDDAKLISWIHSTIDSKKLLASSFRNLDEANKCYNKMHKIVFVSEDIKNAFLKICDYKGKVQVAYNTIESKKIKQLAEETLVNNLSDSINLIAVGTLKSVKGYDRLLRIVKKLVSEKFDIHLYILGTGPLEDELKEYIVSNGLEERVTFLGYQINPYKYLAKSDVFICSSYSEGFSTAATEALIVGTPVCTVDVSGMKEMLGENNEYGIVTENSEEALYEGMKSLISNKDTLKHYQEMALIRGERFNTKNTVDAVEALFEDILKNN